MILLVVVTVVSAQQPGWRKGKWIMGKEAPEDVKEAWAARPPMFGGAPEANKAPVRRPYGNTTGRHREPAPLGNPLWLDPAHDFQANVIMGLALNYRLEAHQAFVGTARANGYRGDIVIFSEPLRRMQGSSAKYLRDNRVVAYAIEPDCSQSPGGSIKHKTCKWRTGQPALPLAIIRHALYLAVATLYSPQSNFYIADYRDTFFQSDPFAALDRPLRGLELLLVAEHWPFKQMGNCPFNGGWIRNCWGRNTLDAVKDQVVLCSGSYLGAQPAIVNFERRLLAEVDDAECHKKGVPSDQGYVNYMYYTGFLPDATFVQDRGTGVVNTVGSLDGSRPRAKGYLPTTHVNIGEYWQLRDDEGFVLQDDKRTRSPAVHQYDRFHLEFRDFIPRLASPQR